MGNEVLRCRADFFPCLSWWMCVTRLLKKDGWIIFQALWNDGVHTVNNRVVL